MATFVNPRSIRRGITHTHAKYLAASRDPADHNRRRNHHARLIVILHLTGASPTHHEKVSHGLGGIIDRLIAGSVRNWSRSFTEQK